MHHSKEVKQRPLLPTLSAPMALLGEPDGNCYVNTRLSPPLSVTPREGRGLAHGLDHQLASNTQMEGPVWMVEDYLCK